MLIKRLTGSDRILRVRWTVRRSNQWILKGINLECSLEGLKLKLKLQYLAIWCKKPTHWKRPWCWERLRAGGEGDDKGWDGWMTSPTQGTWVWANSGRWWRTAWHATAYGVAVGHDLATEQQQINRYVTGVMVCMLKCLGEESTDVNNFEMHQKIWWMNGERNGERGLGKWHFLERLGRCQ